MKARRTPFAMVPLWVYEHPDVTPTVMQVYLAGAALAYDRNLRTSVAQLEERTGMGKSSIYAAVRTLEGMGGFVKEGSWAWFLPTDPISTTVENDPDGRRDLSTTVDGISTTVEKDSATVETLLSSIDTSRDSYREGAEDAPKPKPRKTRLTDDFTVTPAMEAWARKHTPLISPMVETPKFIDYWMGRGDPMADWTRTWQNWMRNAKKFAEQRTNGNGSRPPANVVRNDPEMDALLRALPEGPVDMSIP